jgi:hypothetical protein
VTGVELYPGCIPCPPTQYCPEMGMGSSSIDWSLYKCKNGYLCNGGNSKRIGDSFCPPDHYCIEGVATKCPSGKFITVKGAASIDECIDCPPGKVCPNGSVGMLDCPEGWYCPEGGFYDITPGTTGGMFTECPIGHYCPKGSFQPLQCKPGTYQDTKQSTICKVCPKGYYC